MTPYRAWPLLLLATMLVAGCSEGDFDQRVRGDIEQLRAESFTDINSNPRADPNATPAAVTGTVTTGGLVTLARVLLHPVGQDGVPDLSEASLLGNTITVTTIELNSGNPASSTFTATVRRPYAGPILVRVLPYSNGGAPATYAHPAMAMTAPRWEMETGDELSGYVPDFPNAANAVVVSPLTTLAVERARTLGGLSGGNLSLASRQVGRFFGVSHTRISAGNDLLQGLRIPGREEEDLALAAVAQLAVATGTTPLRVVNALVLDIASDGELNGSGILIPGTAVTLPDIGQAGVVGTGLLRNGWLRDGNDENVSRYAALDPGPGTTLGGVLDYLDTPRRLADFPEQLVEVSQQFTSLTLRRGESSRLGLRGFSEVDGQLYLVMSSDGPTVAFRTITSSNLAAVSVSPAGVMTASATAPVGSTARITTRIQSDGVQLTGGYDRTFTVDVTVVAP